MPERLREEITAILVFTLAVIIALPQVGLAESTLLERIIDSLGSIFGLGIVLLPIAISIVAVEIWRSEPAEQRLRRTLGGMLATLSVVGMLALGSESSSVSQSGGYMGYGLTLMLRAVIGEVGTGVLLFAVGVVAVFLVTGTDIRTLRESWARITYRPEVAYAVDLEEQAEDSGYFGVVEETSKYASTFQPLATEEPVSPQKRGPVINVPKPEKAKAEPKRPVAQPAPGDGEGQSAAPAAQWRLPRLSMLERYKSSDPDSVDLESKARRIEETLGSFKVEASVREIFPGPAVTLFALEPALGVKVRRITELQNDLALALAAPSIRIEAPVPGMARVGIEIPNESVATVGLREVLESETFQSGEAKLPLPLGRDVNGRYIIGDLTRMPHLLIAGATGSGKSVCINSIIATFLLTKTPEELQMILIDPKMVELVGFERVPHLKGPVVTEMDKVVGALRMVLREMERRYQLFARLGVRNIDGYNLRREDEPQLDKMPYLVVIIDELADLMMTTPEEVETLLVRLAQMARATGIHLLIATQRPSVDV
ncbi:MAG TPA: DNA translocase FtsK 4TM domain-containing protein, partial [Thermomicrobiales bacterium]|nr:DNA translocase FtsK 4TM domain-containing protein [Thermomicrobiales bacterium]